MLVIPITGLISKACLRLSGGTAHGLDTLQRALSEHNRKGKGVLTCQHKCPKSVSAARLLLSASSQCPITSQCKPKGSVDIRD